MTTYAMGNMVGEATRLLKRAPWRVLGGDEGQVGVLDARRIQHPDLVLAAESQDAPVILPALEVSRGRKGVVLRRWPEELLAWWLADGATSIGYEDPYVEPGEGTGGAWTPRVKYPAWLTRAVRYASVSADGGTASWYADTYMLRGNALPSLPRLGAVPPDRESELKQLWDRPRFWVPWGGLAQRRLKGMLRVAHRGRLDTGAWRYLLEIDAPVLRIRGVEGLTGEDRIPDCPMPLNPVPRLRLWEGETTQLLAWRAWTSVHFPWEWDQGIVLRYEDASTWLDALVLGTSIDDAEVQALEAERYR